jgi:hypothetical protein
MSQIFNPNSRSQKIKEFFLFFGIQLLLYLLLVVNYRFVAWVNYPGTVITDFIIASFNFFVVRKIAKSEDSLHQWAGYAIGGAFGGLIGLWISTFLV